MYYFLPMVQIHYANLTGVQSGIIDLSYSTPQRIRERTRVRCGVYIACQNHPKPSETSGNGIEVYHHNPVPEHFLVSTQSTGEGQSTLLGGIGRMMNVRILNLAPGSC